MNNDKYRTDLFAKSLYSENSRILRYKEGMTPDEREKWVKSLKAKVTELMEFSPDMYDSPEVHLLISKQRFGYRVEKYEMSPEPGFWFTFLVLIPDEVDEKRLAPGVLCLPGYTRSKEQLCMEEFWDLEYEPQQSDGHGRYHFVNAQAFHFVQRGFVAVAVDDLGTNEVGGDMPLDHLAMMLAAKGRSYMGLSVLARWSVFKWLKTRTFVNREKCAITAHSLGTGSAMLIGLLDDDVKAIVHNDWLCDYDDIMIKLKTSEGFSDAPFNIFPQMHKWFDFVDIFAAYAPRKLFITEGGPTYLLEKLSRAYKELGAEDHYKYIYYPEYSNPENRPYDNKPIPSGLTVWEYLDCVNVNPNKHFFKFEAAVPWLIDALDCK